MCERKKHKAKQEQRSPTKKEPRQIIGKDRTTKEGERIQTRAQKRGGKKNQSLMQRCEKSFITQAAGDVRSRMRTSRHDSIQIKKQKLIRFAERAKRAKRFPLLLCVFGGS